MPKLVHAADLHLDSPLTGLERYERAPISELRGATRAALDRLVELCVGERASLLLIAGDLFDGSWRDYSSGLFLCERMARLREAGVAVVWLRGNHDAASRLTRHLRMPENVREFSTREPESVAFEALNVVVHGQGFAKAAVDVDLTARYPRPVAGALNIGLLHTALEGHEGEHARYAPCRLSALIDHGYDYWALGHVHTHEIAAREPWVVYPGNLQGRHARETGPKGAVVVEFDSARVTSVEHRALDVVRWVRCVVDATAARTLDDVADLTRSALSDACRKASPRLVAARIRIAGATDAHAALRADPERALAFARAAALDAEGQVWVEKLELATRPPGESLAELRAQNGPLAYLLREFDALADDPVAREAFLGELSGLSELTRKVRPAPEGERPLLEPREVLDDALALVLARLGEGSAGP